MADTRQRPPVAYLDEGDAQPGAPALLLVHGWAARGAFFAPQIEALAAGWRVVIPDLAGHGASRGAGAPTIAGMADDVFALLERLDLKRVLAVGWSMGASVLWELLGRPGQSRIAGLVTVDMTPRVLNDDVWSLGLANGMTAEGSVRAVAAMRADWGRFSERVSANVFAADADPGLRARYAGAFADNDADAMATAWSSLIAFDARPLVARIATPTLVTYGAHSKLYAPAVSACVAQAAPHAAHIAFERSGHAPHLEEPQRFNRVLTEFAAFLSGQDVSRNLQRLGRDAAAV